MENHLVSDNICNTINLLPPPNQGMSNNVGSTFSVDNTIPRLTISNEQDN